MTVRHIGHHCCRVLLRACRVKVIFKPAGRYFLRWCYFQASVHHHNHMGECRATGAAYGPCLCHCLPCVCRAVSPSNFIVAYKPERCANHIAGCNMRNVPLGLITLVRAVDIYGGFRTGHATVRRCYALPAFNLYIGLALYRDGCLANNVTAYIRNIIRFLHR